MERNNNRNNGNKKIHNGIEMNIVRLKKRHTTNNDDDDAHSAEMYRRIGITGLL